jgi:hypothetical protein
MKPYPLHNLAGGCPSSRHNHMTLAIALRWLLARSGSWPDQCSVSTKRALSGSLFGLGEIVCHGTPQQFGLR